MSAIISDNLSPARRSGKAKAFNQHTEWYTPERYVEAVRAVLGVIDLDPCSTSRANEIVMATKFFTMDQDGLTKRWMGSVFCSPPYGRIPQRRSAFQGDWTRKGIAEYEAGRVEQIIFLLNAATDSLWFMPLWDFPICFVRGRIPFESPDGATTRPSHANCFVYVGPNEVDFVREFKNYGACVCRADIEE